MIFARETLSASARLWRAGLIALLLAGSISPGRANSVDNAHKFCAVMDSTGLLAAKCAVSSWASAIGLLVQADADEAKEFCAMVAVMAGQNGLRFDPQWRIQVLSPASGDKPLAACGFGTAAPSAPSLGLRPQLSN